MSAAAWRTPTKFYVLIFMYSIQRFFYYVFNLIFFPQKYRSTHSIAVPPSCLSENDNGFHHYAKLAHTKLHYVELGNRSHRLLLLIHGYPEFWYSWRFQLRNLSSYYWVVALDMKGHGDSDKPKSQSEYDIPILIQEIHDFLTALGREKCSILTHGLGGLVGWYFLHQHPGMVESFVSIGSPHPISFLQELSLSRVNRRRWFYFCAVPYFPEKEAMKDNLKLFDELFSGMLTSRRGNMTKQDIEAYKYTFSRYQDWIGPINYFRTLLLRQGKFPQALKKVNVPVLFIIGNSDPYCSLEMICKSSEYAENFTLKIVEGGGHFLNQEMPNYVNSIILDFMKILDAPFQGGEDECGDRSILRKMFGAGKTVVSSTVNYGNQVWSSSKDAVTRSIPKKLT